MSSGTSSTSSRTRKQRLLRFGVDKSASVWELLFNWEQMRFLLCYVVFVGLIAAINCSWRPAFFYQLDFTPSRSVNSRVEFSVVDEDTLQMLRFRARSQAFLVYYQKNSLLDKMKQNLHKELQIIRNAKRFDTVGFNLWTHFVPVKEKGNSVAAQSRQRMQRCFNAIRELFKEDEALINFDLQLDEVLLPYRERGVLKNDEVDSRFSNIQTDRIKIVEENGSLEDSRWASRDEVLLKSWDDLTLRVKTVFGDNDLSDMLVFWLKRALPSTLDFDYDLTRQEIEQEESKVQNVENLFRKNSRMAEADKALDANTWNILKQEDKIWESQRPLLSRLFRFLSAWATLCLFFFPSLVLASQSHQQIFDGNRKTLALCGLTLAVVALAKYLSTLGCNAQSAVLFMYAVTLGIAFGRRTAYLLFSCLLIVIVLGAGGGLTDLLYSGGVVGIALLPLNRYCTRKNLIYISFLAAITAFVLAIVCNVLNSQPLNLKLLQFAGVSALWIVGGGFLMQGLAPFEEWFLGILTDTQLLELSNPTHPLMQELVQRAPSTYNHSTFVAAISESAARSIGAWGLLCRVGALYHDIGKFVTPEYFVENQKSLSDSQHDNLTPNMSALVIINHVKNGVVLAKKRGLPQQVIDLIEQHHGTTLVKFFYHKAIEERKKEIKERSPELSEEEISRQATDAVDETMFRYPGPKPQTKEAAILMLADCVESACRTLVEPSPSRVNDLVRSIAADKLQDGQFDETTLTFNELKNIQEAIVLAIMSIYHARIKYPDQEAQASKGVGNRE